MSRAFGAAVLALLLVPLASAQFAQRADTVSVTPSIKDGPGFAAPGLAVQLLVESPAKNELVIDPAWILVGKDNLVNLTVREFEGKARDVTFRVNVTGATATPETVTVHVPGFGQGGELIAVHPADVGRVTIRAVAEDLFDPTGAPAEATLEAFALTLPAVRMVDPPMPAIGADEDLVSLMGPSSGHLPLARVRTGDSLRIRMEAHNPLDVATGVVRAALETTGSAEIQLEIPALEPGESKMIEVPEFIPAPSSSYAPQTFGPGPVFQSILGASVEVGGISTRVRLFDYEVRNGAVVDVVPAAAWIQVQDGISIEVLTPRHPVLGAPSRVKFNITNFGATRESGTVVISLQTPAGLFYEVQGPESHEVSVSLAPEEKITGTIDFTPRVTGVWTVTTNYQSSGGFGWGGGGGAIEIAGPVTIQMDQPGTTYVRIGEPVRIDLTILTTKELPGAAIRVTSGSQRYFDPSRATGGEFSPGLSQRLLDTRTESADLGTLRPGGALNASVEVSARSSGRFDVVPYVVSEGFAYTSTSAQAGYAQPVSLAVQPRPVATAWAIAPFMVALGVFVGTWTLRTRFVK